MKKYKYPAVLTIAGSDSGGGAGIQADLKTFSALGCYGTSAITAVTVQNTLGVTAIHSIPREIVQGQILAVIDDIIPSAIKIGMVHTSEQATAIALILKKYSHIPVVLDPVMVSSSGHNLIQENAIISLKEEVFPLASIITPNLHEAMLIAKMDIQSVQEMKTACVRIIKSGCNAVLIKGGHLEGGERYDVYYNKDGEKHIYKSKMIHTTNTHGTGCTLSSAIASFIALGNDLPEAIKKAKVYIQNAIEFGKDVLTGNGTGPLNHFFDPKEMNKIQL